MNSSGSLSNSPFTRKLWTQLHDTRLKTWRIQREGVVGEQGDTSRFYPLPVLNRQGY